MKRFEKTIHNHQYTTFYAAPLSLISKSPDINFDSFYLKLANKTE